MEGSSPQPGQRLVMWPIPLIPEGGDRPEKKLPPSFSWITLSKIMGFFVGFISGCFMINIHFEIFLEGLYATRVSTAKK